MFGLDVERLLLWLPAVIIALTLHEYAHARVADLLGDPTPRYQGRLSLNPLVHLDPIGFLLLLVAHFGWARPVQVNPLNFRGDKRRGMSLVALAGPGMNLLVAFTAVLIRTLAFPPGSQVNLTVESLINGIIFINIYLALFNLIPLPPLDGANALAGLVQSDRWLAGLERYGYLILIMLIFTNIVGMVLDPLAVGIYGLFNLLSQLLAAPFI